MTQSAHLPVLKDKVIDALNINADDFIVDATFGGGGHARAILSRLGARGRLLAIDRDPQAAQRAREVSQTDARVEAVHAKFSQVENILHARGLIGRVNGILFDLGISSLQLDSRARGFGFNGGELDMRMDTTSGITAAEWLTRTDERELMRVLREFGEERFAMRIARAIKRSAPKTAAELSELIAKTAPTHERNKHPATRAFQAIRIAINDELGELARALPQALEALAARGRLVAISFHSLEDRIVKRFLRAQAQGDPYPPDAPVAAAMLKPRLQIIGKPQRADLREVNENRRARSAILRVGEKLGEAA